MSSLLVASAVIVLFGVVVPGSSSKKPDIQCSSACYDEGSSDLGTTCVCSRVSELETRIEALEKLISENEDDCECPQI